MDGHPGAAAGANQSQIESELGSLPTCSQPFDFDTSPYFKQVRSDNRFEVLAEEITKRVATYQNGSPTTLIGPPTSGASSPLRNGAF